MLVLDAISGVIREQHISDKAIMTVPAENTTVQRPVPDERRDIPVIDAASAAVPARLGRRITELYGRSMDIEWARTDGTFAVLQARPITGGLRMGTWSLWAGTTTKSSYAVSGSNRPRSK